MLRIKKPGSLSCLALKFERLIYDNSPATNPNLGKDADQINVDFYKPETHCFKGLQVFLRIRIFINNRYNSNIDIFMDTTILW